MKTYNAFQLKLLMAILMVFDHLHCINGLLSPNAIMIFHIITRVVSVWFAFVAVEGFINTHNRAEYNDRLFIWEGIMFVRNSVVKALTQKNELKRIKVIY